MTFVKKIADKYLIIGVGMICTFIVLYVYTDGISGNDFWWHVKVGEWIFENKSIPTSDIFSWYGMEKGIEWTAHEWLSELVFYLIYSRFGEFGIYILSLCLALLMMYFLIWYSRSALEKNIFFGSMYLIIVSLLCKIFFFGRPQIFSYFFVLFEVKILYDFLKNPKTKEIYLIPVIACVWSNMHGGSSNLSYILCGIACFCISLNFNCGVISAKRYDLKWILKLAVVMLLAIGAILINPIGLKVLIYPYVSLSDDLMMWYISEWRAPDAKIISNLLAYFMPIAIMMVGFISEKKKIQIYDIAFMGSFLFLFFRSIRFIMLWCIVAVFCAFPYMPELKTKKIVNKLEKGIMVGFAVLISVLNVFLVGKIVKNIDSSELIKKVVSDEMIQVIKEDKPHRIFNDYDTGETLIYNEMEVFFDARADLYSAEHIMENAFNLMYLSQTRQREPYYVDVEALVNEYQFDAILILKKRPLYAYLVSHSEKYDCVYEEDSMGYFKVRKP